MSAVKVLIAAFEGILEETTFIIFVNQSVSSLDIYQEFW